jgi:hypothetical protein
MQSGVRSRVPAAIRCVQRPLDDAQYLIPDLSARPDPAAASSRVCWLIDNDERHEEFLAQSLTALSLQRGVGEQRLCFLCSPTMLIRQVAQSSFGDRWGCFRDVDEALSASEGALIGYLGRRVIFHDARTTALLVTLLLNPGISSTSCELVTSFGQGNSRRPMLVDGGSIPVDVDVVFGGEATSPTEMLWRAVYPTPGPPAHLWLAKLADVRRWRRGELIDDRLHVITSRITASYERGDQSDQDSPLAFFHSAGDDRSIRTRVLVG